MSFTYDDSGIRTSKTVNGVTHTYQLNGSQIVAESWGDKLLVYIYDATGSPIGMMYRTTSYDISEWDIFYKTSYSIDDIWNAAQDIYANYPALLEAARKTLGR